MAGHKTVPAVTLEQFYIGCALIGLLAAQGKEPNQSWVAGWALEMGQIMAARVQQAGGAR